MPKLSLADQTAKVSANEARRRKEQALAELREIEVQQKRGELVPAGLVRNTWATVAKQIRDAVLRIPDKCALAVAAVNDPREAREILRAECEAILRSLSDVVRTADH